MFLCNSWIQWESGSLDGPVPTVSSSPAAPIPVTGVLVTGIAGNLGRRLAPLLKDRLLVGVDLVCPILDHPCTQFCQLDLSQSDAPAILAQLIRENNVQTVIHLAFVLDPVRAGALDEQRQWEINVRGTRHVLEAIEQVNQEKLQVQLFVYLSSVTAYGPNLPGPVSEDAPLQGHTFLYAIHKRETDLLCQAAHPRLGGCAVYILRAHIFLGRSMDNFILRALRGEPSGRSRLGRWMGRLGWRMPVILPRGRRYDGLFQFIHVDDVARLLPWLCSHYERGRLEILNLQGKGKPLTNPDCAAVTGARVFRIPSYRLVDFLLRFLWWSGLSGVPPKALPYFTGPYIMKCDRLRALLGEDFDRMIHHTAEEALRDAVNR